MREFQILVDLLKKNKLKITAAESCTGGLFCASLVEIASASEVFECGFITYSEKSKNQLVGVQADIIENYGVVSRETAAAMAHGAALHASADLGIGITGFAGPSGGDKYADVGTVCTGVWFHGNSFSFRVEYKDMDRNGIRFESVKFACEKAIAILNGYSA